MSDPNKQTLSKDEMVPMQNNILEAVLRDEAARLEEHELNASPDERQVLRGRIVAVEQAADVLRQKR